MSNPLIAKLFTDRAAIAAELKAARERLALCTEAMDRNTSELLAAQQSAADAR